MKRIFWVITMVGLLALMGFDFSKHSIPLDEIYDGGPPKDGIPALFDPKFIKAEEADYLKSSDRQSYWFAWSVFYPQAELYE